MKSKLILGSSSPRRLELINNIGFSPERIIAADIDETPLKKEKPEIYVDRIALEKIKKIESLLSEQELSENYILTADTIAAVGTRILGKPSDRKDAKKILNLLSGRKHRVFTSVYVRSPNGELKTRKTMTFVKFKRICDLEMEQYLDTDKWQGKAGAYGIQEDAGGFVISINGTFSGVIGLPLYETKCLLKGLGYIS